MQLNHLDLSQLKKLSSRINNEIARRNSKSKDDLFKRMKKLAAEHGFELSEILRSEPPKKKPAPKKTGSKLPIKYWNPLRPNEGWSGHARRPVWVVNWLANGGKLEELMIRRT